MFEYAVRNKVRWQLNGTWCVEDLWDMGVEQLDTIFKGLSRQVKEQSEESLLDLQQSEESETLDFQIKIVKRIVQVKLNEKAEQENEMLKAARKQKLLGFVEDKQDESLRDMSEESLQELIDNL